MFRLDYSRRVLRLPPRKVLDLDWETTLNKLARHRQLAFIEQDGRCYYCHCVMWRAQELDVFCERFSLTRRQALQLRCTAEHVTARCDGGRDGSHNIVAACLRCNRGRHGRKNPYDPKAFVGYVQGRIAQRKWHDIDVRDRGLLSGERHTGDARHA